MLAAPPAGAEVAKATPAAAAVAHERLWLGSAWYPEQWPEAAWDEDLRLMKAHGANVVRIGEYAWSRMEPAEGQYDMDWLVRATRLAAKHGLKVVVGTPTDTPPAWLTQKYPDTLQVDGTGKTLGHGGRRQFSISSRRYRDLSRAIVTQMARALKDEPNVIGWQIGNEPTDESYDPEARAAWVAWLKQRYGSLDRLNAAWTTAYWSQTYTDWSQVPFNTDHANPGWMLELKRFITAQWRGFHQNQIDAIRAVVGGNQFITINFGGLGWANRFDRYEMNRDLDFASWDEYVGSGHLKPWRAGASHDLVRGWKRKNFWVMETQPGFVNWAGVSNMLYPGETRALAWQAVGHGADAILYWQWRNARNGQETMHGSIVGPDGKPLPIYPEVQQIGRDMAKASAALAGTQPVSPVAILQDYPSRWAIDFQLHHRDYDQIEVLLDYYRPLKDALGAVDIVEAAAAPLAGYKLVVAPNLNIITDAMATRLTAYVRGGGHLILGPRSGLKDEFNRLETRRQPGPLADLLGGQVEQFHALDEAIEAGDGKAVVWAEQLSPAAPDTDVLLRYGKANGWLDGKPAVISRRAGKGRITYVGALVDDAVMKRLIDTALRDAGVTRAFAVPADVELMTREGGGRTITILVNHGREARDVALPGSMTDVLGGGKVRKLTLPAEGVAVLQQ
ncbi:cellulase family glycosylhydrolase [Polymorphobacter fuscus]|uniref:Beta-galactosidase n=2 Tax=Sandarakinorhabdus fusca TaxID=1439888 RepID=A0A7C9GQA3_9SPHN|nr:beta-galactosidase [Polymorphobacter fuscus]KAB7646591.1 beta-galactosidase [Polymorphobacter fuscus]MQT17496.1 cellulase family glycosylhydrolase [Polymorphobacter fuscus]